MSFTTITDVVGDLIIVCSVAYNYTFILVNVTLIFILRLIVYSLETVIIGLGFITIMCIKN